ncbi:MAG: hypothetical protein IPK16_19500 [Anaerolineales bacterium]|nr:hypothetical protein [Anaerolineales bacterium]
MIRGIGEYASWQFASALRVEFTANHFFHMLDSMFRLVRFCLVTICLFGTLLWPGSTLAQAEAGSLPPEAPDTPIRFERLTQEEGLSQNSVLALFQDREGFLWIGTQDGLNRYDGYNFAVYKNNVDDPESISLASILEITQDRKGDIWVGTWGGGLNKLDPLTGKFTRYQHDPNDPGSLPHDLVPAVLEDSRGVLWVGTQGGGLATLDRETGQFTTYHHNPDDPDSLGSNFISALMEDDAGALWVGTGGFNMDGSGLDRFDPETGKFFHYAHDPADPDSLSSNSVSSCCPPATARSGPAPAVLGWMALASTWWIQRPGWSLALCTTSVTRRASPATM